MAPPATTRSPRRRPARLLTADDGSSNVTVSGAAAVTVNLAAGTDRADLTGSTGSDTVAASPTQVRLSGSGYAITVNNGWGVVVASNGGNDRATLSDSAADDVFEASPSRAFLHAANNAYGVLLYSFPDVAVSAGAGGNDTAYLTDSTGADAVTVYKGSTTLSGTGYSLRVLGFDGTFVTSVGGNDQARFYDSAGDDLFGLTDNLATVAYSDGSFSRLIGFRTATAYGTAGGFNKRIYVDTWSTAVSWVGTWQ